MALRYRIPYCLHRSAPGTGRDADGSEKTGRERPLFDTLIAVDNPHSFQVVARFSFFSHTGQPVLWDNGAAYWDYILAADQSLAMTLIPGNPFPGPPQDFLGSGLVEFFPITPFANMPTDCAVRACLGGGGYWPRHWNEFAANVPVYSDIPVRMKWRAPYAIKFRDANHTLYAYNERRIIAGGEEFVSRPIQWDYAYSTGLVISNFDSIRTRFHVRFKVGQPYLGSWPTGRPIEYSFDLLVDGGHTAVEDLFNRLIAAGYPPDANAEGFVEITSDVLVRAVPYLLVSNGAYDCFSWGIEFG